MWLCVHGDTVHHFSYRKETGRGKKDDREREMDREDAKGMKRVGKRELEDEKREREEREVERERKRQNRERGTAKITKLP